MGGAGERVDPLWVEVNSEFQGRSKSKCSDFLHALYNDMSYRRRSLMDTRNLGKRPTIAEALERFKSIKKELPGAQEQTGPLS